MTEDFQHLYNQTKLLVEEYQNELIPGFRAKIEELEVDNNRLREMWADACSKLSVESGKVKHGKWFYYSSTMMECSICGRHTARHRYEYCPHCGSIMDGGFCC